MPNTRFGRRITIFPGVRLNFSKSGVSITFGKRGFGFTFGRKGIRFTAGIPGSGIFISEHIKYDKIKDKFEHGKIEKKLKPSLNHKKEEK